MNEETKFNLLPEAEKRQAQEGLKRKQAYSKQVKLTVPQADGDQRTQSVKKNGSWWQRRKQKRAQKKTEKMRRKGETGQADVKANKDAQLMSKPGSLRPELFSDVMKKEPSDHWWEREDKPETNSLSKKEEERPPVTKSAPVSERAIGKPLPAVLPDSIPTKSAPVQTKKGGLHEPSSKMSFSGPSINLVPEGAQIGQGSGTWPLALAIVIFTTALWVIIGGVTYSRVNKAQAEHQQMRSQISQLDKVISDSQASRQAAQRLQGQYDAVGNLINNHIYWTVFLQKLEELTIPDVYYVSLNGDLQTNKVNLRLIAKDYAAGARQIRSLERSGGMIQAVRVGEARIENQPDVKLPVPIVAIDLELTLLEGVLKVQPEGEGE